MTLRFGEHLRTGIDIIDDQHRGFLQKLDELFGAFREHRSEEEILRVISFLEEYIAEHFKTEETFMVRFTYPACYEHRARHIEFNQKVHLIRERYNREGATESLSIYLNRALEAWCLARIAP